MINQSLPYHNYSTEDCIDILDGRADGLSSSEVRKRQKEAGENSIPEKGKTKIIRLIAKQFIDFLVLVLVIAAAISFLAGHMTDVYVIAGIIIINTIIGFTQEYKAERAISSLKKMIRTVATVLRDAEKKSVQSKELVPGDIIFLEQGDSVPADARILEYKNLQTIEASLTGESMPVSKNRETLSEDTPLAERSNIVYKGTHLARGSCKAIVIATGVNSELGKIARSLQETKRGKSNFKKKTAKLARIMAGIAVSTALIVFIIGYFVRSYDFEEILLITIATLVSSIPEGLPAVLSILLAIGAKRMADKNAIIREFTATEVAGSLSVILTDKTGTITQGVLSVNKVFMPGGKEYDVAEQGYNLYGDITPVEGDNDISGDGLLKKAAMIAAYCQSASVNGVEMDAGKYGASGEETEKGDDDEAEEEHPVAVEDGDDEREGKDSRGIMVSGDPTEAALLVFSRKAVNMKLLKGDEAEKLDDLPFNSEQKFRATLVKYQDNSREVYAVGAPEKIISLSSQYYDGDEVHEIDDRVRQNISKKIEKYSSDAMRVIVCASKEVSDQKERVDEDDVESLTLVSILAITDPPREDVREAVSRCKSAGIRVIMVTGDHPETGLAIARSVGISGQGDDTEGEEVLTGNDLDVDEAKFDNYLDRVHVYARVEPNTKLKIAERLRERGEVIGMTGDGVNDAPALKSADVGIAMGQRGTDVAKDAAHIVLSDDSFSSIVDAIQEGRIIFRNVRLTSFFLVTTNFASTSTLIAAVALGMPIPLLATQILWINLVTDGVMDIALATEPGSNEIMEEKPVARDSSILTREIIPFLLIIVPLMVVMALLTFNYYRPDSLEKARAGAFLVVAMTQVFNVFNLRSLKKSVFSLGFFSNRWINIAFVASLILQLAAIELPFMQELFRFESLPWLDIIIITALSSLVIVFGELNKWRARYFSKQRE